MDWYISSWYTYNNFYKGNLDKLELWNKGTVDLKKQTKIELYDKDGNFYKNDYKIDYKKDECEFILEKRHFQYRIIQINYDFYKIPIPERHQIKEGRTQTKNLLIKFGIKGFHKYKDVLFYEEFDRLKQKLCYVVNYPIENVFCDVCIRNTKSFINFDYQIYIDNYEKALKEYPEHKDEIEFLKYENLKIICDFYDINIDVLQKKKFDRLKYAIRLLNKKINTKIN